MGQESLAAVVDAQKLKEEANQCFKDKLYDQAIELYTKAIEINADEPVFYGNRSFAYLKEELYGAALADASKAIELDKTYVKGYYRRATANMALGKFKLALKDYETVFKARPNDPDAKAKFKECQKIVKRIAFEKAIAIDHKVKSIADSINLDIMGNHESEIMNQMYGFDGEVRSKYSQQMATLFTEIFNYLPLAHLINQKVLVMHGGLFNEDGVTLDDIRKTDRFRQPPEEGVMCDLLWSDPQPMMGRCPSKRGVGCQFGPDVTKDFCTRNNLAYMIRVPYFSDTMGNKGAFITLNGSDLKPKFTSYEAVEHPKVRPMQYANSLFGFL